MAGKKRKTPSEPLSPEEEARRERQRELRALALEMRARGEKYVPRKAKRLLDKKAGKPTSGRRQERKDRRKAAHDAVVRPPPCDVVVVPLYWKQRAAQAAAVRAAAESAARALRERGVVVEADMTNEDMPGRRFLKWEKLGVKVRVEIGPSEAERKSAVLAVAAGEAGAVAQRRTLPADGRLVEAAVKALKEHGVDVDAREGNEGKKKKSEEKAAKGQQERPEKKSEEKAAKGQQERPEKKSEGAEAGSKARKKAPETVSAEAEDDFEGASSEDASSEDASVEESSDSDSEDSASPPASPAPRRRSAAALLRGASGASASAPAPAPQPEVHRGGDDMDDFDLSEPVTDGGKEAAAAEEEASDAEGEASDAEGEASDDEGSQAGERVEFEHERRERQAKEEAERSDAAVRARLPKVDREPAGARGKGAGKRASVAGNDTKVVVFK